MKESDFSYAPEEVKREWNEIYGKLKEDGDYRSSDWEHFTPEFLDSVSADTDAGAAMRMMSRILTGMLLRIALACPL